MPIDQPQKGMPDNIQSAENLDELLQRANERIRMILPESYEIGFSSIMNSNSREILIENLLTWQHGVNEDPELMKPEYVEVKREVETIVQAIREMRKKEADAKPE